MSRNSAQLEEDSVVVSSVSKFYSVGGDAFKALNDVSLTVKKATIVALVGPSGSGKTTLLNITAALDFATSGTVIVDGHLTNHLRGSKLQKFRNQTVGVIFQQFFLIDHLTALENVMTTLIPRRLAAASKLELSKEALEKVGLEAKANRYPSELSGGELQRVAIARGLVGDPQVILADEPTGNLDIRRGLDIVDILAAESRIRGKTVIVATHDSRILEHVDGVAYLNDGVLTRLEGKSIESS